MKRTANSIILLLLPLLFIGLSAMYKNSQGEFFLGRNWDPSYAYLINSLNLARFNGHGVGHIDHPGTTVQEIGAVTIYVWHRFYNPEVKLVTDVLDNPEFYLNRILLTLVLMNSLASFILGLIAYKSLKNIKLAVFLQLSPFYFFQLNCYSPFELTYSFIIRIPELTLIFTVLMLITLIITFHSKDSLGRRDLLLYAIAFGIVCGFGLATKISFFPIVVIPVFLLKRISYRSLFLLTCLLFFCIFVYPALSKDNISYFFSWVTNLTVHSSKYGVGPDNFIDTSKYFQNILTIFSQGMLFGLSFILVVITFMLGFFSKFKACIRSNKYYMLMCSIFAAETLQILIVAKHFEVYYMLPSFMLSFLNLFIVYSIFKSLFPVFFEKKIIDYSLATLFLIAIYFQIRIIINENDFFKLRRDESRQIMQTIKERFNNSTIVASYGSSSREIALFIGIHTSGQQFRKYMEIAKDKYPNVFYFDRWNLVFYDEYIKSKLIEANKFIFQTYSEEGLENFISYLKQITNKQNITYERVIPQYENYGQVVYQITLEP